MTPPAVLVDGDEPVLVAEAVAAVVAESLAGEDRSLAVEEVRGEEVDLSVVADGCATPPFLAGRRIVVVRDIGRFSADDVAPLVAYLEDPLPTTVLVLAAGGGTTAAKLAAAVKARGRIVSTRVTSREASDWFRDRVRRGPVRLDKAAENLVRRHLGEDIARLGPLLDLLAGAYGEGARLAPEEVDPYLGQAGSVAPWDLTDAIDAGRTEDALVALRRLLGAGERHPLVVLAILHRHVQGLLRVDDPAIRTEPEAAAAMGIAKGRSTYPAKKALHALRGWGSAGVADAIGLLADAEVALKGASAWPEEAVLEVLVARLCFRARSSGTAAGGRPRRA